MMERELQQNALNKEEEEAYKVKKKTHDLLPNADENITKLKVSSRGTVRCYNHIHWW